VAIKGRPDVTSETVELQVIRPAGPQVVKEKEVVMIPCEYCGTLMPETSSSCPNCGAPRRT
jgi:rubrerythrin